LKTIPYDLIIPFCVGVCLLLVAGVQYHYGKVYTRGGRGTKLHEKPFVTKEEAPGHFWTIIGLQSVIGIALMAICGIQLYQQLA